MTCADTEQSEHYIFQKLPLDAKECWHVSFGFTKINQRQQTNFSILLCGHTLGFCPIFLSNNRANYHGYVFCVLFLWYFNEQSVIISYNLLLLINQVIRQRCFAFHFLTHISPLVKYFHVLVLMFGLNIVLFQFIYIICYI